MQGLSILRACLRALLWAQLAVTYLILRLMPHGVNTKGIDSTVPYCRGIGWCVLRYVPCRGPESKRYREGFVVDEADIDGE